MSERTEARRVLVTGTAAVGKSTVCRLVARSDPFDEWFLEHLDGMLESTEEGLKDPVWSKWEMSYLTPVRRQVW